MQIPATFWAQTYRPVPLYREALSLSLATARREMKWTADQGMPTLSTQIRTCPCMDKKAVRIWTGDIITMRRFRSADPA